MGLVHATACHPLTRMGSLCQSLLFKCLTGRLYDETHLNTEPSFAHTPTTQIIIQTSPYSSIQKEYRINIISIFKNPRPVQRDVVLYFSKQQGPLLDFVWQTCLPKQRQAKGLKWVRCQASKRHIVPATAFVLFRVVRGLLFLGSRPKTGLCSSCLLGDALLGNTLPQRRKHTSGILNTLTVGRLCGHGIGRGVLYGLLQNQ